MPSEMRCRLTVRCSIAASERFVSRLYAQLAPLGLRVEHITIRDDGGRDQPVQVAADIGCDDIYRDTISDFIKAAQALPGVISVDYEFSAA